MKVTKQDGSHERQVLTAMIVSTPTLARIAPRWDDKNGSMRSRWSNIIGGWCVRHYRKYNKAPGRNIESLFQSWAERHREKDVVDLVEKFLQHLSGNYARLRKRINPDYMADLAAEHFNRTKLLELRDQIDAGVEQGQIDKTLARVNTFKPVELDDGSWIHLFHDREIIQAAITKKKEPALITYNSKMLLGLNNFFGRTLRRDTFCCLKGVDKSGKSYWLLDFAWRAIQLKLKVAFFQVGDLSRDQIIARFITRAVRRPILASTVQYPTFIDAGVKGAMTVTRDERRFKYDLKLSFALAELRRIARLVGDRDDQPLLKICARPNGTVSVQNIETMLKELERRHRWKPDVVIIDYVDVLAPPHGIMEHRLQVDYNFQALRSLAQTHNNLVLTACQGNAAAYKASTMGREHFSGSKTQNAHVDAMLAINVNTTDRENQTTRLNWIVNRDQAVKDDDVCHVAGCISLANPAVISSF